MSEARHEGLPTIDWVNHAGYILRYKDIALMTDPWLHASIFDNGWDLLARTKFKIEDFESITHIWFSHEHPDHFTPPDLRKIPVELRKKITVLFQWTRDKRVVEKLQKLDFIVHELPLLETQQIGDDFEVTCQKNGTEDSWIFTRAGDTRILNVNDCVFLGDDELHDIKRRVGDIDVLLTQFGYAEKFGNPEDVDLRRRKAQFYMDRTHNQVRIFQPKYLIPFASFIVFSHEENFYMNSGAFTPQEVYDKSKNQDIAKTIVLYPGERWTIGGEHDSQASVGKYMIDAGNRKPLHKSDAPVPMEELKKVSEAFVDKLKAAHSPFFLRLLSLAPAAIGLRPISVYLTDHDQSVSLSVLHPCHPIDCPREKADLEMYSEPLAYLYSKDWGGNTLMVNGRFTGSHAACQKLYNFAFMGLMMSAGERFNLAYLLTHLRRFIELLFSRK